MLHSKTYAPQKGVLSVQPQGTVRKYLEYLKHRRLWGDVQNTRIRAQTSQIAALVPRRMLTFFDKAAAPAALAAANSWFTTTVELGDETTKLLTSSGPLLRGASSRPGLLSAPILATPSARPPSRQGEQDDTTPRCCCSGEALGLPVGTDIVC